jgi:hypothetical protein
MTTARLASAIFGTWFDASAEARQLPRAVLAADRRAAPDSRGAAPAPGGIARRGPGAGARDRAAPPPASTKDPT